MEVKYRIYQRDKDNMLILSLVELPSLQKRAKRKYVGRKAKIEAVFRLTGERLPDDLATGPVNEYIAQNIFKSPKWEEYLRIFNEVGNEQEIITDNLEFRGSLLVELTDNCSPNDERVIHMLTRELMGCSLEEYKGLKNPINFFRREKYFTAKSLDECFAELLSEKEWYTNSSYDKETSFHHKDLFLAGKLPDEIKRAYLKSASYELARPELWKKNNHKYS